MTDFNGRTILLTGATGGIGGATVRHLVDAGADVIASGQSEEGLKTLVDAGVRALPFDLASEDSVRVALDGWTYGGWLIAAATAARSLRRWTPTLPSSTR